MTATPRTLRVPQVAEQFNVGKSTVQRWVAAGLLEHIRVGGVVLIEPAAMERFLAAHKSSNALAHRRSLARNRSA